MYVLRETFNLRTFKNLYIYLKKVDILLLLSYNFRSVIRTKTLIPSIKLAVDYNEIFSCFFEKCNSCSKRVDQFCDPIISLKEWLNLIWKGIGN